MAWDHVFLTTWAFSCFLRHSILSENSLTEEASQQEQQPRRGTVFPGPVERSTGTVICVPGSMLRSIRGYREEYDTYMRVVADDPVGGFNPWAIADRYKTNGRLQLKEFYNLHSPLVVLKLNSANSESHIYQISKINNPIDDFHSINWQSYAQVLNQSHAETDLSCTCVYPWMIVNDIMCSFGKDLAGLMVCMVCL